MMPRTGLFLGMLAAALIACGNYGPPVRTPAAPAMPAPATVGPAGGRLEVATDDPGYAEWIDDLLPREPLLENACAPLPHRREVSGRLATAYEVEWRGKGRRSACAATDSTPVSTGT